MSKRKEIEMLIQTSSPQYLAQKFLELETMVNDRQAQLDSQKEAWKQHMQVSIGNCHYILKLEAQLNDKDCTCKHCEYHAGGFGYPPRKRS